MADVGPVGDGDEFSEVSGLKAFPYVGELDTLHADGSVERVVFGDAKYGRLFTRRDVEEIVMHAGLSGLGLPRDYREAGPFVTAGLASIEEHERLRRKHRPAEGERGPILRLPADEPLFLLRAQDTAALPTVSGYLVNAQRAGAGPAALQAIVNAGARFATWAARNPERMKVVD